MARIFQWAIFATLLAAPAAGAVVGEPKKAYPDRPDDLPREHVVEVIAARTSTGSSSPGPWTDG